MKIAFVIGHPGITGVNNVVTDLARQMVGKGHECTIFFEKDLPEGRNSIHVPCDLRKLDSWKELLDYQIVHAHGLAPMILVGRHSASFRLHNVKLITTLHCYCFQDLCALYGKMKGCVMSLVYLLYAKMFDKIVCLSRNMMQYYSKWLPKSKMNYVYNTGDIDLEDDLRAIEKQEIISFKGDGILIGMNGVLIRRKGMDLMLEALAKLPDRYKLFLVGDGKDKKTFESLAKKLGVDDRVYFAGSKPEAHRYLPYYDIFALPSRSEGFPLALLEAAAMGCKVVVSDLPIVKECFSDKELSIFSLKEGSDGLVRAVKEAMEHPEKAEALKHLYEAKYSPVIFGDEYERVYRSVLD
jgi:glycosyltransferase involved in cell wall biosynthesis